VKGRTTGAFFSQAESRHGPPSTTSEQDVYGVNNFDATNAVALLLILLLISSDLRVIRTRMNSGDFF